MRGAAQSKSFFVFVFFLFPALPCLVASLTSCRLVHDAGQPLNA